MKFAMASAAVLVYGLVLRRYRPLLMLQRGATYARAACFLAGEMADAAWAVRWRWEHCCDRARRES